jgi:hypothetical protein
MEAHNVARMGASGLGTHPTLNEIGQVVKRKWIGQLRIVNAAGIQ